MGSFLDLLRDPSLQNIDIDGQNRFALHIKMLHRKKMLRDVFMNFHHLFRKLDRQFLWAKGLQIELGAGICPMRDTYPDVMATDVVDGAHLDHMLNAESMELDDSSVRVFFAQNSFHHFPHPDRFFMELERVLVSGGGAILIEPYHGIFATFLYKRLFKTEGFDKTYPSWETPVAGPMNGANQALSYIIFVRDRAEFERKHPTLKIVHLERCGNYLSYLLSGGLNFRQLCPDVLSPFVEIIQWCLSPFNRWLALHHIVVIRKQ